MCFRNVRIVASNSVWIRSVGGIANFTVKTTVEIVETELIIISFLWLLSGYQLGVGSSRCVGCQLFGCMFNQNNKQQ